jgi:putative ABC transport system permease protein|nr:ABC transporter permease [Prevotella sp. UBA4952]
MKHLLDLKSYLVFLSRNKTYTLINVFGLSFSLMFVILITVYTTQEYTIDQMHSKADRIFSLGCKIKENGTTQELDGAPWKIQHYLKDRYPEIEKTCAISTAKAIVNLPTGEQTETTFLFTDPTFYQLFDFQLTEGDRNHVLDKLNSAVLTEDYARKVFGKKDPLGKVITYNDSIHLVVTGIAKKMTGSSIGNQDIIARYENMENLNPTCTDANMSNAFGGEVFILTKPHTHLESKIQDMDRYFRHFYWIYRLPGAKAHVILTPFSHLYFSKTDNSGDTLRGNKMLVNILFSVGLVILLFSVINYINLTIAQSGNRAREMATRRLLGSQKKDIAIRLISESILLCSISMIIGVLLALVGAPYTSNLLNTKLYMSRLFQPIHILELLLCVLIIGILSGIIPAFFISRAKPIEVVRGTFQHQTKMIFSKFMIILQSTITIVLTGVSLTMILQVNHLTKAPLGYRKDNIIGIDNPGADSAHIAQFLHAVRNLPHIRNISACNGYPLNRGSNSTIIYKGKAISFQIFSVDRQFMNILGIHVEKKYPLNEQQGCYINHQAYQELRLKPGIHEISFYPNMKLGICGILMDFHIGDITSGQYPVLIYVNKKLAHPRNFIIQVTGNPKEAYREVQKAYKETFHLDLDTDHPFIDQQIEKVFDQQVRMSKTIPLFAGIAILISLLGLIAMSSYFIQQRNKEIAVRKVFGSDSHQIMIHLIRTFLSYVLIAFVLSVPVTRYFMSRWLSGYNYRISLSPWIFLVSGLFCIIISIGAILIQSYRASHENPVIHIQEN